MYGITVLQGVVLLQQAFIRHGFPLDEPALPLWLWSTLCFALRMELCLQRPDGRGGAAIQAEGQGRFQGFDRELDGVAAGRG